LLLSGQYSCPSIKTDSVPPYLITSPVITSKCPNNYKPIGGLCYNNKCRYRYNFIYPNVNEYFITSPLIRPICPDNYTLIDTLCYDNKCASINKCSSDTDNIDDYCYSKCPDGLSHVHDEPTRCV